jgi:hypothetical protein
VKEGEGRPRARFHGDGAVRRGGWGTGVGGEEPGAAAVAGELGDNSHADSEAVGVPSSPVGWCRLGRFNLRDVGPGVSLCQMA